MPKPVKDEGTCPNSLLPVSECSCPECHGDDDIESLKAWQAGEAG